jgi:hypothetical protein
VPIGTLGGNGSFFYSLNDALQAARFGDTITIEPGASPDLSQPVTVADDGLTIQGDPNVPASILPAEQLRVLANQVALTNLNLTSVVLGSSPGTFLYSRNNVNKFRYAGGQPTNISGAIVVTGTTVDVVSARENMFSSPPSTVTYSSNSALDLLNPLSQNEAFVQALYNDLLGRTGALAELDGWVNVLNTQGQAVVANAILHSNEALGRIVDAFYLHFLGRQSDASGRANWISFLQQGGTEENLETMFLASPEYLGHINTDFVQSLYINLLGRTGSPSEVASWNSSIQSLGLAGIAREVIHSQEYRQDTVMSYLQAFFHVVAPDDPCPAQLAGTSQDLLSLEKAVLSTSDFFTIA